MKLVRTPPDLLGKQNIPAVNQGPSLLFPLSLCLALTFLCYPQKERDHSEGQPFSVAERSLKKHLCLWEINLSLRLTHEMGFSFILVLGLLFMIL